MAALGAAGTAAARGLCSHVSSLYSSRSWVGGKASLAFEDGQFSGSVSYSVAMPLRKAHQDSNYTSACTHNFQVVMAQLGVVEREGARQASSVKANQKSLSFVKYQGLGNDFLLVDNRDSSEPMISEEEAIRLCDRNFGVGGDGVIFLMPGVNGSDYSMRIFNSDGSEPEMCGNGIRCLARFIAELENVTGTRSYSVHTLAGLMIPKLREDGQVIVDMGPPILNPADIPTKLSATKDGAVVQAPLVVDGRTWSVTCVSMGNPHCVTYGDGGFEGLDLSDLPLSHIGPLFENHEVFPARINTHFVEVLSRSHVRMRVWERGAGPTLACGTGACALVVAGVLEGRIERACRVDLPGGPLEIEWNEEDNHVYMTGPGTAVFSGKAYL